SALALYLGITYLEGGQPDDALKALSEISPSSLYSPHKAWYSAMAHLQADRPAEAKPILQKIKATDGHFKQLEANLLLAEEVLTNF
ncbi:MAG: tetratricopeptide repeat protein, partial [Bacteroidia bacterium]